MGNEFEVHYWTPENGWGLYWGGDAWDLALHELVEAKESHECVKLEWRD